jgi:hypothetical protein
MPGEGRKGGGSHARFAATQGWRMMRKSAFTVPLANASSTRICSKMEKLRFAPI